MSKFSLFLVNYLVNYSFNVSITTLQILLFTLRTAAASQNYYTVRVIEMNPQQRRHCVYKRFDDIRCVMIL